MVFGVGADADAETPSRDPIPFGGGADEQGGYVPPATRTPGQVATEPASQPLSWNTNDTPVRMDLGMGGGQYPAYEVMPFYEAALYPNELRGISRANGTKVYDNFVAKLRAYTKQKLGTDSAVDDAWTGLLKDAQQGKTTAMRLLNSVVDENGVIQQQNTGGSRGAAAYTGPRASITVQAESDIRATANALALEMIGRPLNDRELARVTKRMRTAEQEQPQVTTGNVARTVTTQGLTAQGREDVLRDVIAKRPEFEQYQLDTTVMDAMNAYVQEKRQVIDV